MKNWGFGCAALVAARAFVVSPVEAAEDSLGEQGQLVIDNRFQLLATTTGVSGGARTSSIQLSPSVAYFVLPRFSVGLGASLGYQNTDASFGIPQGKQTTLTVAPRAGYVVPLSERFDLYPELELSWTHTWLEWTTSNTAGVAGSLPVLFRPASHFFVGLGPTISKRWQKDSIVSEEVGILEISVRSTIGGYFDL